MKKNLPDIDTDKRPGNQNSDFGLSQSILDSILNFSDDAFLSRDLDGCITSWSAGAEAFYGYSSDEIMGKPISLIIPQDKILEEDMITEKIMRGERVKHYETKRKRKDGTLIDVSLSVAPVKDVSGYIIGFSKIQRDITEKKRIEQILTKSEKEYRTLFDNNPLPLWVMSISDHKFLRVNDAALRHYGYTREEFLQLHATDIRPPEEIEKYLRHETTQNIGPNNEGIWIHRKKDGTIIKVEIYADDIIYNNQSARLILANDITERIKADEQLLKEKELSDTIINSLPGVFYLYDNTGKFLRWNKNFEKVSGYTSEEIAAMHPLDFFDENEKSLLQEKIGNVFKTGTDSVEAYLQKKNKEKICYYFTGISVDYENKICLMGVGIDISQQKKAEEEIIQSERRFRNTLDKMLEGVQILDFNWRYVYVNDAVAQHNRYTKEELLGNTLLEKYPGIEKTETFNILQHSMIDRVSQQLEHEFTYPDNSRAWFELSIQPVPEGLFILSIDISERKKSEESLLALNEQLRQLTSHLESVREEERTRIAREIHDELGQQLTALKMDVSSLKNKLIHATTDVAQKIEDMIHMINSSIRTIRKIIIELRPGILDDLGLLAALEWQAKEFEKNTALRCRFSTSLSSDHFSQEINTAVFRIFQESLTNVARHAEASEVEASLYASGNQLVLEIKDNGKGISNDRKFNKASFGLLGMKERAKILGGEFSIQKIPEGGTVVTLKIPFA